MSTSYDEADALGLAEMVASGAASPGELLDEALARVAARNPALNAVHHVVPEVARAAIEAGLPQGPFRGVPFLLKDLGAEARAYPTSNGSRLYGTHRWSFDSEIFLRFERAGLVTFGRTASPEFGIGPVTEGQVYGGPVRNPWDLGRTPGGSSGGAAAAVAAGIVPAAHGSDGGGSVRIPASCSGLVGFKPSRGLTPDGPAFGEGWAGMATDGVLTRSLRDTAALLDAMVGPDLGDPYAGPPLGGRFSEAAARDPVRLRIAVTTRSFEGKPVHPDCAEAVARAAALLSDLGQEIVEEDAPDWVDIGAMMRAWTRIVACGTALTVDARVPRDELDWDLIDGVTRGAVRYADDVSGAQYLAAVNAIHAFGRRMARWFTGFDVLLSPVLAEPPAKVGRFAPLNEDFEDYRMGPGGVFDHSPFAAAFNASGQPAISLPLHWSAEGHPIGVHLAARFGEDLLLTALAGQIEQAAPWAPRQQALIGRLSRGEG